MRKLLAALGVGAVSLLGIIIPGSAASAASHHYKTPPSCAATFKLVGQYISNTASFDHEAQQIVGLVSTALQVGESVGEGNDSGVAGFTSQIQAISAQVNVLNGQQSALTPRILASEQRCLSGRG